MAKFRIQSTPVEQKGIWYLFARVYNSETGENAQRKRSMKLKSREGSKKINTRAALALIPEMERKILAEFETEERTEDLTLKRYINAWIAKKNTNLRGNTAETYQGYADKHIIPAIGAHNVTDITFRIIQNYVSEKGETLKADSIKKQMVVVQGALDDAVVDGVIPINPARVAKITYPTSEKFTGDSYTADEYAKLLNKAKQNGEPLYSSIMLAGVYGLRREELLGLRWCDLDLDKREMYIKNTIVNCGGCMLEEERTKSKKSYRPITLIDETIPFFENLKQCQIQKGWTLEKIVRHQDGRDVRPDYLTKYVPKLMQECGLKKIRLHDLRHTTASLISTRVSPKQVQDLMGHEKSVTTLDIYTQLHREERDETAKVMGGILKDAGICF